MHVRKELSKTHYGRCSDGFYVVEPPLSYKPWSNNSLVATRLRIGMSTLVTQRRILSLLVVGRDAHCKSVVLRNAYKH
jgi:hypothetical protein